MLQNIYFETEIAYISLLKITVTIFVFVKQSARAQKDLFLKAI